MASGAMTMGQKMINLMLNDEGGRVRSRLADLWCLAWLAPFGEEGRIGGSPSLPFLLFNVAVVEVFGARLLFFVCSDNEGSVLPR